MSQFTIQESSEHGRLGSQYAGDTTNYPGEWGAVQALTDCAFTTLTGNCTGGSSMTLPAGMVLLGYFTVIKLASGTAILYKAE